MARHYAIIKADNGEATQHPLKPWVRQNLNLLPNVGLDPENQTTSQIKSRLRQLQWRIRQSNNEVFLVKPDENGGFQYSDNLFIEIMNEDEDGDLDNEDANELTFSLEKDLQAALRRNIESLEKGLTIVDNGQERNTIAGRIDITALDSIGNKVIIELKAVDAKPDVIAQTLAYMEAVKTEDNCTVRGIIIASGFSDRVQLAARQIPNLKLIKYKFQFNFDIIE